MRWQSESEHAPIGDRVRCHASGAKGSSSLALVQAQRKPKIPKGTRDLLPDQMAIREMAFRTCDALAHVLFPRKAQRHVNKSPL